MLPVAVNVTCCDQEKGPIHGVIHAPREVVAVPRLTDRLSEQHDDGHGGHEVQLLAQRHDLCYQISLHVTQQE